MQSPDTNDTGEDLPKEFVLANYAVAFVDLLGQRDALKGCGLLPQNRDEVMPLVRKSIGSIRRLQRNFDQFYRALTTQQGLFRVPEEVERELAKLRRTELHYQRFSDGLVLYLCLMGNPRPELLNGVYGLIASCGSLCLVGLVSREPIRSGVDVAWGAELHENELYGCVVANAYALESEVAKHPRVVLGEHLVGYLRACAVMPGEDNGSRYVRDVANVCLSMITQDKDGVLIVDYLGPGFRRYIANNLPADAYAHALEFTDEALARFRAEGNSKLVARYELLKEYIVKNAEHWASGRA